MESRLVENGPWRATRLWNSIVRTLHDGMPLKRHRKHIRTYEECFSANEAIDWLNRQLKKNPNFGDDVSKEQTVSLLQKLFRAGVIMRIDDDVGNSNTTLSNIVSKTPMMSSGEDKSAFFKPGNDLYRLAPGADVVLRTPGKKSVAISRLRSNSVRSPLGDLSNTPNGQEAEQPPKQIRPNSQYGLGGIRSSFRKIKNKHRDFTTKTDYTTDDDGDGAHENEPAVNEVDIQQRQNLNLSYLQSLPANSLVVLDNDRTWREVFIGLLRQRLSDAHVNSMGNLINASRIIYNMTKVSDKGVVQLFGVKSGDLPHWTLSAMKCLANWPKPFRALIGSDGAMPSYDGFENDVFNVVKEYFTSLVCPLTTFELFDVFVSAYIKAEAVSATRPIRLRPHHRDSYQFAVAPPPYLETDIDGRPSSSSTPSGYYSMEGCATNYEHILKNPQERVAHIRQTLQVMPPQLSNAGSMMSSPTSICSMRRPNLSADMSATAIMRNFLPPNTCFETAFMNESPVTRIVPQKGNDVLHFTQNPRPASRSSCCTVPIPSADSVMSSASLWDSRSIATQTSDEEGDPGRVGRQQKRMPKWRRTTRQRKSIAVMETNEPRLRSGSYSTSALPPHRQQPQRGQFRTTSVDNLIDGCYTEDERHFLQKYHQLGDPLQVPIRQRRYSMATLPSFSDKRMSPSDNIILSKTVRKEKRKQREKRGKSLYHLDNNHSTTDESPNSTHSSSSLQSCRYQTIGQYHHLTVKTPMHICGSNAPIPCMDEGMQKARAEPYKDVDGNLNIEGRKAAIESFQLLGLLLPPESRRQLQLLLKFMRRVGAKTGLKLQESNPRKSCTDVVLDTFAGAVLRPQNDFANYDEELCRKIVRFFMENYDDIWTPPICLRKEVEERVYQSLVNKRIEAGEDPYPITFCKRVPSKVYEREKTSGVEAAMLDLLQHILHDRKMSSRDKRKKIKKFKTSYPEIYAKRFPTLDDEPEFMRNGNGFAASFSSLSKLKSVMRI